MYSGNNPVLQEKYDGASIIETRFNIISGGQILGHIGKIYGTNENYEYFYPDNLGSKRVVLDNSGSVLDKFTYSAYGEVTHVSGSNGYLASFTGKEYDDTDLIYFNARYYDPVVGRFLTEDSIRDGLNYYNYCGNNPVNNIDPDGLRFDEGEVNEAYERKREIEEKEKKRREKKDGDQGDRPGKPKSDSEVFDEFMDFLKKQGVERLSPSEPFKSEKIADDWEDIPISVREHEPPSAWGALADDEGKHDKNQRLPEGYHVTEDEGVVRVHQDYYDPTENTIEALKHLAEEVDIPTTTTEIPKQYPVGLRI